jgi:hypothetical protein
MTGVVKLLLYVKGEIDENWKEGLINIGRLFNTKSITNYLI